MSNTVHTGESLCRIHSGNRGGVTRGAAGATVATMSAAREPQVVRMSSLDDIVAAVPHLLGFHPRDSLVVLALRGPRERVAFTARLDLEHERHDREVAKFVAGSVARADADAAIVFVYADAPPDGSTDSGLPREALVEHVTRALPVPVRDAVLVAGDRVWSYICVETECCPPDGRLVNATSPGAIALAAAHALEGRAVLADRASVVRSLAPLGGIAAIALDQAYDRVADELAVMPDGDFAEQALALFDDLVKRYAEPPAGVSADEAARLVLATQDVLVRDALIERLGQGNDEAILLLLVDLARRALPPLDPPLLTCLAWAAYAEGDGLRASVALDRALATDPGYNLARMLEHLLAHQVHPKELRKLSAERPWRPRSRRRR